MTRKFAESTIDEVNEALKYGDYAHFKELKLRLYRNPWDVDALDELHRWHKFAYRRYLICERIYFNSRARAHRLFKKICAMFDGYEKVYFVTLTFSDGYLYDGDGRQRNTSETRRQMIRRFLKQSCSVYVANKDFGEENNREHYHAICAGFYDPSILILSHDNNGAHTSLAGYDAGFANWERVGKDSSDARKIAKYISKLQNHAVKETASKERMIFSRRAK